MATNHTTNYALNLWEPQDSFLREEFNENSQKIDAAMGALTQTVAAKGNCRIEWGTYMGNGEDSKSLTLSGQPVALFVFGTNGHHITIFKGVNQTYVHNNSSGITMYPTWSGNTVTWSSGSYDYLTLNSKNIIYYYIAFHCTD